MKSSEFIRPVNESRILNEVSSVIPMLKKYPGGELLAKGLHQSTALGHNLELNTPYQKITNVSWTDLKKYGEKNWVFVQGPNGSAAVVTGNPNAKKVTELYYIVMGYNGDEQVDPETGKAMVKPGNSAKTKLSSEVLTKIKEIVGKPEQIYAATGYAGGLQKRVARKKAAAGVGTISAEQIYKKFEPLFKKTATAAIANLKGHISDLIKHDGEEEKIKTLIRRYDVIKYTLDKKEFPDMSRSYGYGRVTGDPEGIMLRLVNNALVMSAAYYYPEIADNITGSHETLNTNEVAVDKIKEDIANGSTEKLGTVLYYFKRALVTGK